MRLAPVFVSMTRISARAAGAAASTSKAERTAARSMLRKPRQPGPMDEAAG
jgi:hypothetical protein